MPNIVAPNPLRGEVWRVDLEPVRGSETGKARPALVISDERYGRLPTRVVVPITGWKPAYRYYVWMTQLRVAAMDRFEARIGRLSAEDVRQVAASIGLSLGVDRQDA